MKLKSKMIFATLLIVLMSFTAHATETATAAKKPLREDVNLLTVEATIASIDRSTRQVTLKNAQGKVVDFTLDEDAGRLDDIATGDHVIIGYLEAVSIQIVEADAVAPGAAGAAVVAETAVGEKPAAIAAEQVSVVVTIEAIDLENDLVTLKNKDGELKTVSPERPENLKKVKVGDQIMITYTTAVGFNITEKPASK